MESNMGFYGPTNCKLLKWILQSDQTDEQTGEDRYYIFQACKNLENFRRKTNSGPALPPPSLKIPIKRAKTARHKSRMTRRQPDSDYSGNFQQLCRIVLAPVLLANRIFWN